MANGVVFKIQKYSIHDGPGIRTTIFFKGCPLNCWWCHNPESQSITPQMIFWEDRCINCGECSAACSSGAIKIKNGIPVTNKEKCILCGKCVEKCPTLAREIIGKKISAEEVIKEIEKDLIFYEESGGGVTFSGGEPLMQPKFLYDLLRQSKQQGIHTAVDTSGYSDREWLSKISDKTDLFLYDLKFMDSEKHKKYTGVSNKLILENLKLLSLKHSNIIVRIPIIPGINDDDNNILETGKFISSLNLKEINLLPYHSMSIAKYRRLGIPYKLSKIKPPTEEKIKDIEIKLKKFNLNIKIGG